MRNHRLFWFILGIGLIFAGIFVLGYQVAIGIILFLAGIAVLILQSIFVMGFSGRVKDNYFYQGGSASEGFVPDPISGEDPVNIWDQLTDREGEGE